MKNKTFNVRLVKEVGNKSRSPFDYNWPSDSSVGFCGNDFVKAFPNVAGSSVVNFTISNVRQHKRGEKKITLLPLGPYTRLERIIINGQESQHHTRIMPATGEHFRQLYGIRSAGGTFYVNANPAKK